jgi:hypothetical protein
MLSLKNRRTVRHIFPKRNQVFLRQFEEYKYV